MGRVHVRPEGSWVTLEHEHARLRAMTQIRTLEHVRLGELVRLDRLRHVDDVDPSVRDVLLAGRTQEMPMVVIPAQAFPSCGVVLVADGR